MKRWQRILLVFATATAIAAAYGFYLFNKQPVDVRNEKPEFILSSRVLLNDYGGNEDTANKKYLNKIIRVSGEVSAVQIEPQGHATVILKSDDPLTAITCSFYDDEKDAVKKLKEGEQVIVQGKCTGKLMDVVLNECSIKQ